mmetsp:Transcript_400/g.444  ORF Transcript_400/g.444 Transcript_400/m.444 type:complete len:138 (+) Transcript_400:991-1404(+)
MVLLKDAYEYSTQRENVRVCVKKLALIAGDNAANKAVTLPIIGALLTLRDKNLQATMSSLTFLDLKHLDIIKRLSHFYAPDLEENIIEHIINRSNESQQECIEESPRALEDRKSKLLTKNQYPNAQIQNDEEHKQRS